MADAASPAMKPAPAVFAAGSLDALSFAVEKSSGRFSFPPMKRLAGLVVAVFCLTSVASAEERFSQTLSPADFKAAGLDQLQPEQLARLDEFARAFQARAVLKTTAATAQPKAASAQGAPAKASQAQTEASGAGRVTRFVKPAPPPEVETSRIVGTVAGWNSRTTFTLENGEVWAVANSDRYDAPAITNPAVEIRPAKMFGGFWMKIESLPEVRVRLVSEAPAPPAK